MATQLGLIQHLENESILLATTIADRELKGLPTHEMNIKLERLLTGLNHETRRAFKTFYPEVTILTA